MANLKKGGKAGRKNRKISVQEADTYRAALREKADAGDTIAQGFLFLAHVMDGAEQSRDAYTMAATALAKAAHPELQEVASGWVGDDNDPRQKILESIRANDPTSRQLPENK